MENNDLFLLDVLNILSAEVDCYIQAPSLDDEVVLSLMDKTVFEYFSGIKLNSFNKEILIERIKNHCITYYFQKIQIRLNDKLLFEGYDGVEYGVLSKDLNIPQWFFEKHIITETCCLSLDW